MRNSLGSAHFSFVVTGGVGPSCTPSTPRTILLAYSTDLNSTDGNYFYYLTAYLPGKPYWNTYAYVRLDMNYADDIHYFEDFNAFNQSLYSNPPDPSRGYMDNTIGSDMFDVLKKMLKNTENLCGSTVMIAAKRYPNEVEIEDLISDLQKNHVFVYVLSSDTPSGGSYPSAMFNVATRTNGYCVFSDDDDLPSVYKDAEILTFQSNQIVAQKFLVSGKGSQTIPFKIFVNHGFDYVNIHIIYQDHKVDGSLKSLNFNITDEFGYTTYSHYCSYFQYTECFDWLAVNNTVQYYLNIDYEYQVGRQEVMLVRMYSELYVPDHWLPFNN
ncbi:unnamed protein product [Caenorhabditis brenneri]